MIAVDGAAVILLQHYVQRFYILPHRFSKGRNKSVTAQVSQLNCLPLPLA